MEKLQTLQWRVRSEFAGTEDLPGAEQEWRILQDPKTPARWLHRVMDVCGRLSPCPDDPLGERLRRPGTVIFEGAQGLLLDEWVGFHPHTTWGSPRPDALEALVRESGSSAKVHHFGILRSYLTRHGAGPFPTEDDSLKGLPEPHNADAGWQGRFRRGHPDALLLDYSMRAAGCPLDGILLSHMDVFRGGPPLRWCERYEGPVVPSDGALCERQGGTEGPILRLLPGRRGDLAHQEGLTGLLRYARPCYAPGHLPAPEDLIERVEAVSGRPVSLTSWGPTRASIQEAGPFPLDQ